jgi:anthranilate synthase component 1
VANTHPQAPLIARLDCTPAVLRALARQAPTRYPALFESVASGPLSRCSILFGGITASLARAPNGVLTGDGITIGPGGFLANLHSVCADSLSIAKRRHAPPLVTPSGEELPFSGGWVVLAGYEIAAEIERRLVLPQAALPFDALALRSTVALVHFAASNQVYAVAEADAQPAWQALQDDIASLRDHTLHEHCVRAADIVEEAGGAFLERVIAAKEFIAAGDVYQVNLSRPWRIRCKEPVDPLALYEQLRRANPAPFAAALSWRGVSVVSSSPERLLEIRGRDISTRPIAGTRRRTRTAGADSIETRELVAHPKERAEHVMLIDLERNDLGRVCEGGSVHVDEFMVAESYEHVHHIVSNVRGRLRAELGPVDALRALFPGGTITGCPKVRCMEIIAALEGEGRGHYTGSLGYIGLDGRTDFNILIRTMTVQDDRVEFRAGAGIVADSNPERELDETRAKARGLLAAFEEPM